MFPSAIKHKGRDQDQERDDLKSQEGRLIFQGASTRSNNGRSASKRKARDDDQDEDEDPPPSKKAKKIFKDTSNVASRPVSQDGREKCIPRSTMSRLLREGDAIYDNPPKPTAKPTIPEDVPDNDQAPPSEETKVSHTRGPLAAEPDLLADAPRPARAAAAQSRQVNDRPAQQTSQTRSTDNHPVQGDERGKRTPNLNPDLPPRPYHPSIAATGRTDQGPPVDHDRRSIFSSGRISLAPNREEAADRTDQGPSVDYDQRPKALPRFDFENINETTGRPYQRLPGDYDRQPRSSLGGANGWDVPGRDANSQRQEPPVATGSSFNGAFGVAGSNKNPTRRDGSQFDPDEEPDQLDQWQNNDEGAEDPEDNEEYQDSNPGAGGEDDDDALSITSENLDQDGRGGRGGHQSINAYEDPDDDLEYLDDPPAANRERHGRKGRDGDHRWAEVLGPDRTIEGGQSAPQPAELDRFRALQEGRRDEEEEGGDDDRGNEDRDDDRDDDDDNNNNNRDDEDEDDGQFFPDKKDFPELARKQFLNEAIAEVEDEHEMDLDRDFYQKYQPAMIEILWGEVAHYRGESKTLTRPAFLKYNTSPDMSQFEDRGFNQQEWFQATSRLVGELLRSSEFLHRGRDHAGHKNNFMNAGLQIAVEALLFGRANTRGDTVGMRYPDDFNPYGKHLMAAGSTVLKSVFDEHKSGNQENPREWAKTSAEWGRWRQLAFGRRGMNGKDVIMEDPELIDIDLS
ncbi:hypothetical protein B0H13DRAFT_2317349 [Mycena leptocephala]|nr:hypothetical protein B0H13DRAFT_2380454 [Mycena leptocephala]KAJ7922518.1 hypothetical protein B0H13DRAFT_2317349 [Mycena leptocephala]